MIPDYVFIGNLVLDDIVYADGRTQMAAPGGNALYAALGARLWSDSVGLVARVGKDWPPRYTQQLADYGLAIEGISVTADETLRAWVLYESNNERTYVSRNRLIIENMPSAFCSVPYGRSDFEAFNEATHQVQRRMTPDLTDMPSSWEQAKAIHLCPLRLNAQRAWGAKLKNLPGAISLDMLPYPVKGNLDDPILLELLALTDIFLPSQLEAEHLQPDFNPLKLSQELAKRGPQTVGIKHGEHGVYVYHQPTGQYQHIPAFPVTPVDLTGAGDSFCGGFAVGYAETGNPFIAALYGTVSASFAIEGFGALHTLSITRAQAENRLNKLIALVASHKIIEAG